MGTVYQPLNFLIPCAAECKEYFCQFRKFAHYFLPRAPHHCPGVSIPTPQCLQPCADALDQVFCSACVWVPALSTLPENTPKLRNGCDHQIRLRPPTSAFTSRRPQQHCHSRTDAIPEARMLLPNSISVIIDSVSCTSCSVSPTTHTFCFPSSRGHNFWRPFSKSYSLPA